MKYKVYSIRDMKAGFYSPRIELNEASAIRSFSYNVNHSDSVMQFSPGDFALYEVGEFNDETGLITSLDVARFVVAGSDLIGVVEK